MASTEIWMVDSIAAANLARELNLRLDDEQLAIIGSHMAEHRRDAIELTSSRLMSSVLDAIRTLVLSGQHYRSIEWSDGCRSAEEVVTRAMSLKMLEISPPESISRGTLLRNNLSHARKQSESGALVTKLR